MILATLILVGAWLFPSGTGWASSAGNSFKVSVTVVDSVGVSVGENAMNQVSLYKDDHVIKEFVTRTASSWLEMRYGIRVGIPGSLADVRVPAVFGASETSLADAAPGGSSVSDSPAAEMVVTITTL